MDLISKTEALILDAPDQQVQRDPIAFPAANDDFREARARCSVACEKFNSLSESDPKEKKDTAYFDIVGKGSQQTLSPGRAPYIKPPFFADYGRRLYIGASTFINRGCKILDTPCADITIGDQCMLGPDVHIYCVGHPLDWRKRHGIFQQGLTVVGREFTTADGEIQATEAGSGPSLAWGLIIEDNVWIGGHTTIFGGLVIGKGAVVGAGSLVTKDVPAGHLVIGHPARVVGKVDDCIDSNFPTMTHKTPSKWVDTLKSALNG